MNKIYKGIITFAVAALSLSGCNSFLDTTPTDRVSDKLVWTSTDYTDLYINNFYEYLSVYGQFGSAQFNGNMTEGLTNTFKYGSTSPGSKAGDSNDYVFYPDKLMPSGNLMNIWDETYTRIRRINEFLDSQKKYSTYSDEVNLRYEAQAKFFRAFLYFQLAKRHTQGTENGGLILHLSLDMKKNTPLSSAAEVWEQIYSDLNFAAENLPASWSSADAGRITKYGAYAFMSRAMLYAERWEDAKKAADKVIESGVYSLTAKYADSYKGSNSESIIQFAYNGVTGPSHTFDKDYVPYGDYAMAGSDEYGGKGTPTQEMVEYYETKDGKKVDWTEWHGETNATPPYDQLEPRFHATVIYPGSTWKGVTIMPTENGKNGRFMMFRADQYPNGRTVTGYYLRKLLDENHTTDLTTIGGSHTWVELRLAEVYLNRAEALYRLNDANAIADVNTVRERVGLPASTNKDVFAAIRQERLVELAYEGHLYWDMRRWELAHQEYNNYRCHGLKVAGPSADGKYTYSYVDCDLQDRYFIDKMYIFPIPTSETNNNSAAKQFDEWK